MSVLKKDRPVVCSGCGSCRGAGAGRESVSADRRSESRDSQEACRVERAHRRPRIEQGGSAAARRRADLQESCRVHPALSGRVLRRRTTRPRRSRRSTPGIGRAIELENGTSSWTKKTGNVVRGFVSRIDGSVQPYGLTIPASYDGKRPMRLDVWLHGTQQQMNEVRFLQQQAGPARDVADSSPTTTSARAVRADESLVQVLRGDRRLRSDCGGAQALQHRRRAHRHPRPLDGRPSGLGTPGASESHLLRRLRSERRLLGDEGVRGQSPAQGRADAVPGSGAALRRRRRLRAERVQRARRELRRREGRAVESVDPISRGDRQGRVPADEGIALQVDDEGFAPAVSRRSRHGARMAQGEQSRIRGVHPQSARRDGRQGAESRAVRHLHDEIQQRPLDDDRAARRKLQARRRRRETNRRS